MPLRGCVVLAIDGTHAAGKTTLVHALTAHYRAAGVHAGCLGEPARTSPFIEDIVIHGNGEFDIPTEVDLFAANLTNQLRGVRHHQLLIADKTIINVIAYSRLLLNTAPGSADAAVLDAMDTFGRAWAHTYDAVFCLSDRYDAAQLGDPHRARVLDLQDATDMALRDAYRRAGIALHDVPTDLTLDQRISWVASRVTDMGLDPRARTDPATPRRRSAPGDELQHHQVPGDR